MIARFFDGTIDSIPFHVTLVRATELGLDRVFWADDTRLNVEQQADVLGAIGDVMDAEWEERRKIVPMERKFTEPGVCAFCGAHPAPAHFIACNDCHHMIDPNDETHMCVERMYRLNIPSERAFTGIA